MKHLDKLIHEAKARFKNNKKIIIILLGITIIGIISGSIFMTFITDSDKTLSANYLKNFFDNIIDNKLNYIDTLKNNFFSSFLYITIIFLLGISVIGIPIALIMYFAKSFMLGFSLSTIILNYKFKGILYSIIYVFPSHIIKLILFTMLVMYAIKVSSYLIYAIFNKLEINFKNIMNRYFKVFVICLIGIVLTSILDTYLTPFLLGKVLWKYKLLSIVFDLQLEIYMI